MTARVTYDDVLMMNLNLVWITSACTCVCLRMLPEYYNVPLFVTCVWEDDVMRVRMIYLLLIHLSVIVSCPRIMFPWLHGASITRYTTGYITNIEVVRRVL